MSWSAPMTAVAGAVFTAAQFNQFVRDNLLECPASKATTPGAFFAVSDVNQLTERIGQSTSITGVTETTTSTTYTDLATFGPQITVDTGGAAVVILSGSIQNSGTGSVRMAYDISGATTLAAADNRGVGHFGAGGVGVIVGNMIYHDALTAGSNTFTCKYRVSASTGTFESRRLQVIPF
jgi:hypothetical protein